MRRRTTVLPSGCRDRKIRSWRKFQTHVFCFAMSKKQKLKVGIIQMACALDPQQNLRRAVRGIREAARRGAAIVCLPELFRSRYFCQREDAGIFDLAEPV